MTSQDTTLQLLEWKRLVETMPSTVRNAIPMHLWDRTKLYALDLPVHTIEVSDFHWMLDIPLWSVDGIAFRVTPNRVLASPNSFPEQYRRVQSADLSFPIHVVWHNDRWTILDGVHRVLKSVMEGYTHIAAMVLLEDVPRREDIATTIAAVDIAL